MNVATQGVDIISSGGAGRNLSFLAMPDLVVLSGAAGENIYIF